MNQPQTVYITIQATYENLQVIGEHIRSYFADIAATEERLPEEMAAVAFDVELAVHEVCNNIIDHAYRHQYGQVKLQIAYESHAKELHIDLHDTGRPFVRSNAAPPDLNQPQAGGYGLFLAEQLLDTVTYKRAVDGNAWHLTKTI